MESAGYREKLILSASASMTSTTSWLRTKIKMRSLKTGVIFSITLMPVFIFSWALSIIKVAWKNLNRSSGFVLRMMPLTMFVWNMPRCWNSSWRKEIMDWWNQNISPFPSKQIISGKQSQSWNVLSQIFWIISRSLEFRPIHWMEWKDCRFYMRLSIQTIWQTFSLIMVPWSVLDSIPKIMWHRPVLYSRTEIHSAWEIPSEQSLICRSWHRSLQIKCLQNFWILIRTSSSICMSSLWIRWRQSSW